MDTFKNSYDWHEGCAAGQRYAESSYACGVMKTRPIRSNPYTDTFVTLAEYRTNKISARITYDDIDQLYELEINVGDRTWRLYPEDIEQVQDWMQRIVDRHPPTKFVCRVNY